MVQAYTGRGSLVPAVDPKNFVIPWGDIADKVASGVVGGTQAYIKGKQTSMLLSMQMQENKLKADELAADIAYKRKLMEFKQMEMEHEYSAEAMAFKDEENKFKLDKMRFDREAMASQSDDIAAQRIVSADSKLPDDYANLIDAGTNRDAKTFLAIKKETLSRFSGKAKLHVLNKMTDIQSQFENSPTGTKEDISTFGRDLGLLGGASIPSDLDVKTAEATAIRVANLVGSKQAMDRVMPGYSENKQKLAELYSKAKVVDNKLPSYKPGEKMPNAERLAQEIVIDPEMSKIISQIEDAPSAVGRTVLTEKLLESVVNKYKPSLEAFVADTSNPARAMAARDALVNIPKILNTMKSQYRMVQTSRTAGKNVLLSSINIDYGKDPKLAKNFSQLQAAINYTVNTGDIDKGLVEQMSNVASGMLFNDNEDIIAQIDILQDKIGMQEMSLSQYGFDVGLQNVRTSTKQGDTTVTTTGKRANPLVNQGPVTPKMRGL